MKKFNDFVDVIVVFNTQSILMSDVDAILFLLLIRLFVYLF
jgi:hypothetical protein